MPKVLVCTLTMSEENRDRRRDQLKAVELGPDIQFDFELFGSRQELCQSVRYGTGGYRGDGGRLNAQDRGHDAVCIDTMMIQRGGLAFVLDIPVTVRGRLC